ncbi:MAG: polyprenyl synthetase family protein [Candidatus Binatia bacterium]
MVRAGADTVLLVDNGGDVTALGAALAASGRLGAWFGVARRPIPPAVLAARVPVYLWFEPEDVVPPVVPAGRACAFVPVGVDGEDVPTATARLLALRDAGFGSLVPRFFIPVPNTREWRQLERRWGLRPGARASLDGTRPCFALSGWEPADGPELLALWTRANQPPASTPRTTTTSTTTYSLRGLSAVVDGYLANLPVRGPLHHAHDTVHALLAALPGAPPVLAPIDEYPFVAWQGQNLVHVVQRALEQRLRTVDGASEPLLRALQHAVLAGGKRIRPILVLVLTCAHDVPLEAALPAALTTEWVHSASLIQDDLPCMDDDVVRRHGASTHLRHGESLALLASDALIALAFEDLAALAAHPAVGGVRAAALVGHLARAIGPAGLVGGQAADLLAREAGRLGPADVLDVHRRKTAPLFALAADLATTLADVAPERARALRATLVEMGVAFQIIDDVLDQTPGNAAFGRPAGSDRRRGLPTLASLLGATEARRLAGRRLRPHLRVTDTDIHLHPLAQLARFVLERRH